MAIYYDDYDHDSPAQYYNPEPTYYEPEPAYYDAEPVYENESYYDDRGFDDALEADVDEDFGEGFAPDIPSHGEGITEEQFYEEGGVEAGFGEREQWDGTRYDLHDSLEYVDVGEPLCYAPEVVYAPLTIDLAHATEADIDAAAWAAVFAQGPPASSSPDAWYDEMDAWRLRIVADTDAEAAASAQDIVATPELPVQTSWIAEKLDELQDALQRGEIDHERYEHEHNEWLEDEAEDQRLQAEGWAYDEERGDYWHPTHGWGEYYDPEESTDGISLLPDSTASADETPTFPGTHSPFSDFPALHDLAADIDQPLPLPHITLDLDEPTRVDFVVDKPVSIVRLPPAHVNVSPSSLFSPLRPAPPKRTTARFATPPTMYMLRDPPHPLKHPTSRPRGYRSSSARPAAKNRRSDVRHTRCCPDLQRGPPPHLSTPSVPAADPDKPPDTPITKAIRPAVVRDTADNITVPAEPVPPDIAPSTPPNTLLAIKSDARPPRFARAPPIASVHAMALPIPPNIPHTRPSAAFSAERRRNAQRRLAKKSKS